MEKKLVRINLEAGKEVVTQAIVGVGTAASK